MRLTISHSTLASAASERISDVDHYLRVTFESTFIPGGLVARQTATALAHESGSAKTVYLPGTGVRIRFIGVAPSRNPVLMMDVGREAWCFGA